MSAVSARTSGGGCHLEVLGTMAAPAPQREQRAALLSAEAAHEERGAGGEWVRATAPGAGSALAANGSPRRCGSRRRGVRFGIHATAR